MHTIRWRHALAVMSIATGLALIAESCSEENVPERLAPQATQQAAQQAAGGSAGDMHSGSSYAADVTYTLGTNISGGKLVFIGVGSSIDGLVNPTLKAPVDALVQITLVNQDGAEHDLFFEAYNAKTDHVLVNGSSSTTSFRASKAGESVYFCTLPGHRAVGMEGTLLVGGATLPSAPAAPSIVRDPTDMPGPLAVRAPQSLRVDLEAVELEGRLADGASYTYWTFGGAVPGPFLRVRVGDTVELHLKNRATSKMIHSIDLHAVTGPGGGATLTQVPPGGEKAFTFKVINPGVYVYHCATPSVAHHISNGMYGLILVEPEAGLPKVDREFYVMQGEVYTQQPYGTKGKLEFSVEKLLNERPEYFVFNGAALGLATERPLRAKVGETVRIYFGVGGPNFTSSFHVIGEIFDRVYAEASLTSPPLTNVQTTTVAPGGATMVEFKLEAPGRYILVDHALSRLERGLAGYLIVEGDPSPSVYVETPVK